MTKELKVKFLSPHTFHGIVHSTKTAVPVSYLYYYYYYHHHHHAIVQVVSQGQASTGVDIFSSTLVFPLSSFYRCFIIIFNLLTTDSI
jgi:hypothetical protein